MTRLWIAAVLASAMFAQDFAGDWQGTLKVGPGLRLIVRINKAADGAWTASMFSIDQSPDWAAGIPASSMSVQGSNAKFAIDMVRGAFEGALSADGNTIAGTWTQGAKFPLELSRATAANAWKDPSPHKAGRVEVEKGVELEVLDWGGSGRPLVMLSGLGNSAHIFDKFAPKLAETYHVYGITRRGFGFSSVPAGGYDADRLADDVLAVLDHLKLERAVLAGHSIAGEELSSIGSRHPERVAGLIYLDAGYGYALYDDAQGDFNIDVAELQAKLDQLRPGKSKTDPKTAVDETLAFLPRFESMLRARRKELDTMPAAMLQAQGSISGPTQAILAGERKYTKVAAAALAIYAVSKKPPVPMAADAQKAFEEFDAARTEAQIKAFAAGVPAARIVRLPRANHYVFLSNEADVLREMRAFVDALPNGKT